MKNRITPRNEEHELRDDEFIVSKTDTRGVITYCNRTLMRISGFSESELFGKQHNIIRHPDMPRGAYRLMWQLLRNGDEFFGYVKNLCRDGSYYWVLANVTPDINADGKLVGYYSVRRKPTRKAIATIEPIYKRMLDVERQAGAKDAPDASVALLKQLCAEQGVSYDQFIIQLDQQ
ncbi:PAS domain-containing protein [Marinobacterium stanieri]|uniref:PAS domain S-box-containing protein n=1 Tax=Marinobacterium stanieri TaxID=49186 RepID=A0A1N6PWM4_9GAMM|nr:PAS domain-containing protein [Marinobacterium stanieri]SIQ08686.1 PAS domain S-box-containing protein [Marinobacterium stanieri]